MEPLQLLGALSLSALPAGLIYFAARRKPKRDFIGETHPHFRMRRYHQEKPEGEFLLEREARGLQVLRQLYERSGGTIPRSRSLVPVGPVVKTHPRTVVRAKKKVAKRRAINCNKRQYVRPSKHSVN